ncbi:MAG: tandem-95 repeat protein, partial [Gammaproteobacteria bacterium]|nr:tandem-95 repeat protein [Gammaproteobacteria bacterium]
MNSGKKWEIIGVPVNPVSGGGGGNVATFTQGTPMCSPLELEGGSQVTAYLYPDQISGTLDGSSDITVVVRYGSTTIADLTNNGYSGGILSLSGPALVNTIPAGQAVELEITNNETGLSFVVDYDSATSPSRLDFRTTSYITIDGQGLYDAPSPGGVLLTDLPKDVPVYARVSVSDPFGAYDITSTDLQITDPAAGSTQVTLTDVDVVGALTCGKIYEYAFTPDAIGSWTVDATANEGTEGVTASALLTADAVAYVEAVADLATVVPPTPVAIDVLDNDLGTPDPTSVAIVGAAPAQGSLSVDGVTGFITYTPNAGFVGADTFQYSVCNLDDPLLCSTGSVTVSDCDAGPSENKLGGIVFLEQVPDDGFYTFAEAGEPGVTVELYSDANGNGLLDDGQTTPLQTTISDSNGHYSFTVASTGSYITKVDLAGQGGVYTVSSLALDSTTFAFGGTCDNAMNLGLLAVVDAVDDGATVVLDPATVDVLESDTGNLDPSSVTVSSAPSGGTAVVNLDGTITYTPGGSFSGTDQFEYTVCSLDDPNVCDTATVYVGVYKQLYLSDPGWVLNRVDPVATSDSSTATVTMDPSGSIDTVRDEFNSAVYSNNDGSQNWSGNWTEVGDDGVATTGDILISAGQVQIAFTGSELLRSADLSSASFAELSFDFTSFDNGNDIWQVQANDGSGWVLLEEFSPIGGPGSGDVVENSGSRLYALQDSISLTSTVQIRFLITSGFGQAGIQYVTVDDVQIEYGSSSGVAQASFTQSPVMCEDFTVKATAPITVSAYATVTSGTMPLTPDITATIRYGSTTLLTLGNLVVTPLSGAAYRLDWSGSVAADVVVPAGSVIALDITTAETGLTFTIDYDSQTKPSKIELPASSYISVNEVGVYTASYPGGVAVANMAGGETYYIRVSVTDPFGAYDINGVNLEVVDNLGGSNVVSLGAANAVSGANSCEKIYEYAIVASGSVDSYDIHAVAHEGYEGTVTATGDSGNLLVVGIDAIDDLQSVESGTPGPLDVTANDLGTLDLSTLSIVAAPEHGVLQVDTNTGIISYLPVGSYVGTDTYAYEICNTDTPAECDVATVTVEILPDFSDPCSEATQTKTYYMPYPEDETLLGEALFQASGNYTGYGSVMRNVTSIKSPYPNVQLIYDEWEDGYEDDITNPLQSTTQIWGDGDLSNGVVPGYPTDFLPAGASIVLDSDFIYTPRDPNDIYYDGRDKLYSTGDISVSKVTGDNNVFAVQNAKTTVFDTSRYGTLFTLGLGEITGVPYFAYCSLFITASEDNTLVSIDLDADGTVDLTNTLDEGEVWFYQGDPAAADIATVNDIKPGTTITATKPVGVDMLFGGNDNFGTRNINILPGNFYGNRYYTPVPTVVSTAPTEVYFVNSLPTPITVNWQSGSGTPSTGSVVVAGNDYNSLTLVNESGYTFWSENGESFPAVQIMDADANGATWDWAVTLISAARLTDFTSIAWAPGSLDGTRNDNPIWVTPTSNTTLYIKHDGNLTDTNALLSPCGVPYDDILTINALEYYKIKDTSDNDQSGTALFTCDGTTFAAVYGEDGSTAQVGSPSLDVGTILTPMCLDAQVNAVDDRRITEPETPITIDATENDTSFLCTLDTLSVSTNLLQQPLNGIAVLNPDGTFTYTPEAGFQGVDSFEYQVCSVEYPNVCDIATVYITVTDCNANAGESLVKGNVFLELLPDDGAFDTNETFVSGVQVDLYSDMNCNGVIDGGDTVSQSTISDLSGNYSFSTITGYDAADDFDPVAGFAGNDGALDWDNNWSEQGDNGSPASGAIQITQDPTTSQNAIRIEGGNNGISRTYTFTSATDAVLEFSYRRQGLDNAGEALLIRLNGSTIFLINDGNGVGTDNYYQNISVSIDAADYNANGANVLQFISNGNLGSGEYFWIDNVRLVYGVTPVCWITKINTATSGGSYSDAALNEQSVSFDSLGICSSNLYLGVRPNLTVSDDFDSTGIDIPVNIPVLDNDVVGIPDPSTVSTNGLLQPANGTIEVQADGTITYTPNPGFEGVDSFEYQVCSLEDPNLCDVALVTVTVSCASIPGQNTINGLIFDDLDGDGTLDAGEPGRAGTTVNLYEDSDGDGVLDAGEPLIDSEVSSALGDYEFAVTPPTINSTYLDQFNTNGSGSGSNGSTPWVTSWQEIGEANGFGSGDIQVIGNRLRVQDNDNGGEGAYRIANLFGSASATLSFAYEEVSLDGLTDSITVAVSPTGAAGSWNTLATYHGGNGNQTGTASFDISSAISGTTYVRFLGSSTLGGNDGLHIDNVQIAFTTYTAADYIVQVDQPFAAGTLLTTPLPSTTGIQTAAFTGIGDGDCENNFGILELGSITGSVMEDLDGDGVGDDSLGGVVIELYTDTNGDGVGDVLFTNTTTAANGS